MTRAAAALGNRLLRNDAWAATRLGEHAGKTFRLSLLPFSLALRIGAGGTLEAVRETPAAFDLELSLSPTALPLALAGREALERAIDTRGDTELAQALRELADVMPWFFERELANWVGPIVAQRLADLIRGLTAWPGYAAERLAQTTSAYLIEERLILLKRLDLEYFTDAVIRLRDDVARLEQRIARLA